MNKRIQELEDQCWVDVPVDFDYDGLSRVRRVFNREKFAELIVRECLTLTLGKDRRQLLDKGDLNGANIVLKDIVRVIKHFGIEE